MNYLLKKKMCFSFLTLFAMTFVACTEDVIQEEVKPISEEGNPHLKSAMDQQFDLLGYGYDATGRFVHPTNNKFQIVNVKAYNEATGGVNKDDSPTADCTYFAESNVESFSYRINQKMNSGGTFKLFTGEMTVNFGLAKKVTSQMGFACYDDITRNRHLTIVAPLSEYIKYLTPQFKSDIYSLTETQFITKYGTHMLTDITLGGRLHIVYKATTKEGSLQTNIESGLKVSIAKVFNISSNIEADVNLASKCENSNLSYYTIGGDNAKQIQGTLSLTTAVPAISIENWKSSVDIAHSALVEIGDNSLLPIWELITDPAKKASIKAAISTYIQTGYITSYTPLYKYYNAACDQYFYTTDWNDQGNGWGGWLYQKVEAFLPNNTTPAPANTVPLYHYYSSTNGHWYTTNFNQYGNGNSNWKYCGVSCRVYTSTGTGLVPLHKYYSKNKTGQIHYCFTTNYSDFGNGINGWIYEGIACYVISSSTIQQK